MKANSKVVAKDGSSSVAKFKINSISLSYDIQTTDITNGEDKGIQVPFRDSININLNDDQSISKGLSQNEGYLKIIPLLVKAALKSYDPENGKAAELKAAIDEAIGAVPEVPEAEPTV